MYFDLYQKVLLIYQNPTYLFQNHKTIIVLREPLAILHKNF
jgi:hypothetical protein